MNNEDTESTNMDPPFDDTQTASTSDGSSSWAFDTVKFIAEIEKRPQIYNHDKLEYADRTLRARAWTEIFEMMIPNWHSLSSERKVLESKQMKNKWRSMRDYFMKEYKNEASRTPNQGSKKRKRCFYYDHLLFLVPNAKAKAEEKNSTSTTSDNDLFTVPITTEEEFLVDTNTPANFEFVTPSEYPYSIGATSVASSNDEYMNVLKTDKNYKPQQDDEDYDRMFLLSLLPMMRKVSEEKKLDVRIQMQQALALALKYQR